MGKLRLYIFSKDIPRWFRVLNAFILVPSLAWPLIFYGTIFFFDNPDNVTLTFLLFLAVNAYPIYLFLIAELNARLYLKKKQLSFILPSAIILIIIYAIGSYVVSINTVLENKIAESKIRKEQGWLGDCDTYRVKGDSVAVYKDTVITEADIRSIEYVNCHYARDKKYVYHGSQVVVNADPNTFQILNWSWQRDNNNVFYKGSVRSGVDANSFELIQNNYSKDKLHVYYYDKIVEGADPETFEVDDYTYLGKDKNGIYENGKRKMEEKTRE